MKKFLAEEAFKFLISNPLGIALIGACVVVGGILWYRAQVQEARESEALRARERGRSDSMWNQ